MVKSGMYPRSNPESSLLETLRRPDSKSGLETRTDVKDPQHGCPLPVSEVGGWVKAEWILFKFV